MHSASCITLRVRLCAVILPALLVGCQADTPEDTVLVVGPARQPTLASARDRQVTLFGGLPRRSEAPYMGRARGSMLQYSYTREGADFDCHVDRQGRRMVFASTRHSDASDLYIKSLSGTAVVQLTSDPSSDIQPVFSPDDSRVAFASNRTGNWDIWVIRVDGQRPIQVTNSPMDEVHPSWSLDGKQLIYSALHPKSGQWELWLVQAEQNATPKFVGHGVFPEWSPVEDKILFQRARQRGSRWFSIWTLELVNGEPRYPTEIASSADYAMISPTWSSDGQRIAFTTVKTLPSIDPEFGAVYETSDIWVMDADGGSRMRLTDGHSVNFSPVWSPSGQVLFTSGRSGHENIWSAVTSTGSPPTMSVTGTARDDIGPARVISAKVITTEGP